MEPKAAPSEQLARPNEVDDDIAAQESKLLVQVELPPLSESPPHAWNDVNEKQLRSALIGACKRMPRNAEAHFHLGLMYMRKCDGEEALRSFQHCKNIYQERVHHYKAQGAEPPQQLMSSMARLRSHASQAAHVATTSRFPRDQRGPYLSRLQCDLIAATSIDSAQPDVWNALALLHLTEGNFSGAREVVRSIRASCPEYLDALNNLGLAELALGNDEAAITCFQKVLVVDKYHVEALSNYGVVMLRHGLYDAAVLTFEGAVRGSTAQGRGMAFAWGGLAVSRAAMGMLEQAEEAAEQAERTADPQNKARFAMLLISVRARRVTADLRKGLTSYIPPAIKPDDLGVSARDAKQEDVLQTSPTGSRTRASSSVVKEDPRPAMDSAVLRMRALAREIKSSSASTALGMVLRLRHEYSWEESGNRNFGAEAAERLVEALESDQSDVPAWVQLALLQMGTGEYSSARDFAAQALSRNNEVESGWNALAVASQLGDDIEEAEKAYAKAIETVKSNYGKKTKKRTQGTDGRNESGGGSGKLSGEPSEEIEVSTPDPIMPSEDESEQKILEPASLVNELNDAGLLAISALYNNIGNLKRQEGRSFSEALAAYNTSLKFGGESAIVYNNLALLYISVGRLEDANAMLEHALKLDSHLECAVSNQLKLKALIRQKNREKQEDDDQSRQYDEEEDL